MEVADSKDKSKPKKGLPPGFSAGIQLGLRLWFLFLVGFYFSGTPVGLSILFSALGGIATATISIWLKQTEAPAIAPPAPQQPEEDPDAEPISQLTAARLKRQEKYLKRKQKKTQDRRLNVLGRLRRRFSSRRSRR